MKNLLLLWLISYTAMNGKCNITRAELHCILKLAVNDG